MVKNLINLNRPHFPKREFDCQTFTSHNRNNTFVISLSKPSVIFLFRHLFSLLNNVLIGIEIVHPL